MKRLSRVLSYVFFALALLTMGIMVLGTFERAGFTRGSGVQFVMQVLLPMGIGLLTFGALGVLLRVLVTLYERIDALKAEVDQLKTGSGGEA